MSALRVAGLMGCGVAGVSGNAGMQMNSPSAAGEAILEMLVKEVTPNNPEPTLCVAAFVCSLVIGSSALNFAYRARRNVLQRTVTARVMPVVTVIAFIVHCFWLYNVVLKMNFFGARDNAVGILMTMAVAWQAMAYVWEVFVKKTPLCEDKEYFVAGDVYSDFGDPMFNVAVRFMMQASMLLVVIHVAQEAVDSGSPEDVTLVRSVANFCLAFTLVLHMFVACKDQSTWEELRRLQGVRAIKLRDNSANKTGTKDDDIIFIAPGDFYVRFAMSIVTTGVFHKFLVLAYPLLVFTTFAANSWVVLLKDILAITIVTQLDNLMRPVSFTVYHSAGEASRPSVYEGAEDED